MIESDIIFAVMISSVAFILFYSYTLDSNNTLYNEAIKSSDTLYVNMEIQHFVHLGDSGNSAFSNLAVPFNASIKPFNPFDCSANCSANSNSINRLVYLKGSIYEISVN